MWRVSIEGGFVKKSSVKNVKALNRLVLEVYGEKWGGMMIGGMRNSTHSTIPM